MKSTLHKKQYKFLPSVFSLFFYFRVVLGIFQSVFFWIKCILKFTACLYRSVAKFNGGRKKNKNSRFFSSFYMLGMLQNLEVHLNFFKVYLEQNNKIKILLFCSKYTFKIFKCISKFLSILFKKLDTK
jgi:hypothetical protein